MISVRSNTAPKRTSIRTAAAAAAARIHLGQQACLYFLGFSSGARLELMQRSNIKSTERENPDQELIGYAHLAMSVGSAVAVDELTKKLVSDGFERLDGPRRTGDGYYESVVLDMEGNRIEITV